MISERKNKPFQYILIPSVPLSLLGPMLVAEVREQSKMWLLPHQVPELPTCVFYSPQLTQVRTLNGFK